MSDPAFILEQGFQEGPYNFDVPPPGATIGPIKALLTSVGSFFDALEDDQNNLLAQLTVQHATGLYLRAHGVFYGVTPVDGESDDAYRTRVLAALSAEKLTLGAIKKAVDQYFAGIGAPGSAPTVTVLDLQSDPTAAAAAGLVNNDFLVNMAYTVSLEDAFFLDYAYLDYTAYLLDASASFITPSAGLADAVNRVKAGGEHPVYQNTYTFV